MKNVIEIKGLSKSYGKTEAVKNLSFEVKEGELFAFLGVNGAGKSTTIGILCGMLEKNSGDVFIDSHDITTDSNTVKSLIGVVFQNSVLDKPLSVRLNLESRAALYGIVGKEFEEKLNSLASLLHFEDILDRPVGKLSGGQRRRIDIARALIHSPRILILDEPTTGLDPQTRKTLWEVVSSLRKNENMTVLLTTHYMEEAAEADNVLIIDKGEACARGTPNELKNKYAKDCITLYSYSEESLQALGLPYEVKGESVKIFVKDTKFAAELIRSYPDIFVDFEIAKGKMDDVFLEVTGKALSEEDKK